LFSQKIYYFYKLFQKYYITLKKRRNPQKSAAYLQNVSILKGTNFAVLILETIYFGQGLFK